MSHVTCLMTEMIVMVISNFQIWIQNPELICHVIRLMIKCTLADQLKFDCVLFRLYCEFISSGETGIDKILYCKCLLL